MEKIVVINGSNGVGKDLFVSYCDTYCKYLRTIEEKEIIVSNLSTIDPIKELAKEIGWSGQKTDKDRKFLSDLKDLCTEYNNLSFNYIEKNIERIRSYNRENTIIFIHCREPKEIQELVDKLGARTLLILRPQVKPSDNHADKEVFKYIYDYSIDNSGTQTELRLKAEHFINTLFMIKEKD